LRRVDARKVLWWRTFYAVTSFVLRLQDEKEGQTEKTGQYGEGKIER
jgi:hypothetical protein